MEQGVKLGDMKVFELNGQLVAWFKNLNYGACYSVQVNGMTETRYDEKARIEYTHDMLFGHGRQPIDTRMMHPEDQMKIKCAKDEMIRLLDIKRQQALIDILGVGNHVQPRKVKPKL